MTVEDQDRGAGMNARPLDDTIAGTGPGIPDDGLAPGQDDLPTPPTDEEVQAIARKLGAPIAGLQADRA